MLPYVSAKFSQCQWEKIETEVKELKRMVLRALKEEGIRSANNKTAALSPLQALRMGMDETVAHQIAEWVNHLLKEEAAKLSKGELPFKYEKINQTEFFIRRQAKQNRIRLGFLTADLRKHPTFDLVCLFVLHNPLFLSSFVVVFRTFAKETNYPPSFAFFLSQAASMFQYYDKSAFEVFVFHAYQPTSQGNAVKAVVDHFYEVDDMEDLELSHFIHDLKLDILVDMDGFTELARSSVVFSRPAPIQLSYMGYLGTSASPSVHYMVADQVVIPIPRNISRLRGEEQQKALDRLLEGRYSEKIIFMPRSLYIASYPSIYPDVHLEPFPSRELEGLPALFSFDQNFAEKCPNQEVKKRTSTSFVFCNFNAAFKLDPSVFAVWMNILKEVPDSVLWLGALYNSTLVQASLEHYAEMHGVSSDRLIVGVKRGKAQHLKRLVHCDLWLDSPVRYGSHTLAVDATWMGLPLLTFGSKGLVTRVAASVLHALGAHETVAKNMKHYEQLAIYYATEGRWMLKNLRRKMERARYEAPFFKEALWVRYFESALKMIFDDYTIGRRRHILVKEF
jgi:predicted O-linked N-acetylglucosamine transferase (SPINDLY family)